jgi:peptide chain release factor 1
MADMAQYRTLSREHAEVTQIAGRFARYRQREADLAGRARCWTTPTWPTWRRKKSPAPRPSLQLEAELQRLLLPKDPDDARNAFLEIRAGTGGDESALFAGDLARMYTRYAANVGWRVEVVSESPSELGGYKEVVLRAKSAAAPAAQACTARCALNPAATACSACPPPKPRAASTPAPAPWP